MNNRKLIYDLISEGTAARPVSRAYLTLQTGFTDRKIRALVGELRDRKIRVCGTSNESGYWIAANEYEYHAFIANYAAKKNTMDKRIAAMDAYVEGDEEIDVLLR